MLEVKRSKDIIIYFYTFSPMNSIPLYARIESLLRSKILSNQYSPGEKLPTREELAKQFGVSAITVANAISHLQAEGLITSNRGKGTFVSETIPVTKQFLITNNIPGIVLDASRYEVKASDIQMVRVKEARIAKQVQTFFRLSDEEEVGWIRRIRLLKGVPIWFLENFLPLGIARSLTQEQLSKKPLLEIIKEKTGLIIGRGEMTLEAVPAEPDIAELLHCQTFDPLIHIQVYYWLSTGEPLETANSFLRAEYFKYKVDIDPKGFENM
jgi:GntR family transcriptional regulator